LAIPDFSSIAKRRSPAASDRKLQMWRSGRPFATVLKCSRVRRRFRVNLAIGVNL